MTPEEVEAVLQKEGSGLPPDKYDEDAEPAGSLERRTNVLADVLKACQEAWDAKSEDLDVLAEKLGDGSRDVAWRIPYGNSGILNFFLETLAVDNLRELLRVHSLRVIGNSCADTDENRARIVDGHYLPSIIRHLKEEALIPFTIPVLFNVLVDYEPAQRLASQSGLNSSLITLLSCENLSKFSPFVTYFCKILALLAAQDGEMAVADAHTVDILLILAKTSPYCDDLDDLVSLVSVASAYLANEDFQTRLIAGPNLSLLFTAFASTCAQNGPEISNIDDPLLAARVKQLRPSMLNVLADITGRDAFATFHPLGSPVPQTLLSWLNGSDSVLQSAACLALGNLSRSDAVAIPLVTQHQAHVPLIRNLRDPAVTDSQVLHSTLSFLKNLAIPEHNKPILVSLLLPSCLPRIYTMETLPQVHYAAASLTRLLLANCPSNVKRICMPLSSDVSSPLHEQTSVQGLISMFERADAEPTRLEAARAVAALCRVLHSNPVELVLPDWTLEPAENHENGVVAEDDSKRRQRFYNKHPLQSALKHLITQTKWPSIRSEAWFVFALMSRSVDGASLIWDVAQGESMPILKEAVTGQPSDLDAGKPEPVNNGDVMAQSAAHAEELAATHQRLALEPQQVDPKQKANMAKVDRENVVVLCTELIRNLGPDLPQSGGSWLRDLVKEGSEIIFNEKAGQ